jgi:hypothetical protein
MRDDWIAKMAILIVSLYVLTSILSQCIEPQGHSDYGEAPDYRD